VVSETFEHAPLVKVCQLLNEAGVRYIIAGAYAMILNRAVRATEDVDILIEATPDN
jgi:hypothetical protein